MIEITQFNDLRVRLDKVRNARAALGPGDTAHTLNIPYATRAPWLDDAAFMHLHGAIHGHTLVDLYRCHELWDLAGQMASVPGDFLEVGVWRGGTGAILAAAAARLPEPRLVHLCDTFSGVVKAGDLDPDYRGGEHADTSEMTVIDLMNGLGLQNVRLRKGIFPDDSAAQVGDGPFCLCHIDVDVHDSARDILDWVWPRLSVGGAVVFDDYGFITCRGIARLVDALPPLAGRLVLRNLNGHAVLIKTAGS